MGFWNKVGKVVGTVIDHAPEVLNALQQEAAKKQANLHKEAGRRLKEHERKVAQAEKSNRMSDPQFARKVKEEREKLDNYYQRSSQSTNISGEITYGGLTVSQWNRKWIQLGVLSSLTLQDLSPYNKHIGLYKAELNGQVVYLGRAIEYNNGGFRKRLRDYVRNSDSARTHGSGQKMNENRDRVRISILIVGDSADDVDTVKALEPAMISHLHVKWNVQHNR
ncbi:hypothetical protein [Bacillus sinesaloumensis]|uniref:hypothetical protein n=1 Tax=Litchfieldia sinesaloumensis TaxID=1926280 RepID=UPI000988418D|nr:hypothetical protein [Bacillus sinesaloumensis]